MHNEFKIDAKYALNKATEKAIFICFNANNLMSSSFRPAIIEALKRIDIEIFLIARDGSATMLRNTEMKIKDSTTPSDILIATQNNFIDFMNHEDIKDASHKLTLYQYKEMPYPELFMPAELTRNFLGETAISGQVRKKFEVIGIFHSGFSVFPEKISDFSDENRRYFTTGHSYPIAVEWFC